MSEEEKPEIPAETEPAPAPAAGAEDTSGKRLTKEQWLEIEAHIERDSMSTREICEKYKVSPSAISQHNRRRLDEDGYMVKRGSKKHEVAAKVAAKVEEEAAKKLEGFASKRKARIEDTKEKGYIIKAAIGAKAQQIVLDIAKSTATPTSKANDIKALRHLEKLIEENVQGRLRLLDADKDIDEAELPELVFRDLTEEEIQTIQESSGDDLDDLDELAPSEEDDDIVETS